MQRKVVDNVDHQENELQALIKAMRDTDHHRLHERYEAVKLYLEGNTFTSIARSLGRTRQTIRSYINIYQRDGIAGLDAAYYDRLSRKLSPPQEARLKDVLIHKRPLDVGLGDHYSWSINLMKQWIMREYGQSFSKRGISKLILRLGFQFTKANYMLASADPTTDIRYTRVLYPELKRRIKSIKNSRVLYEDQSLVLPYHLLQHGWYLEESDSWNVFKHQGKLSFLDGIRFLKDALRDHPQGALFIVMSYHRLEHVNDLEPYLRKNPRLTLIFLPPYTPNLEPPYT
ncbi:helix-turn-helix domain-containing protein [Paenibacillus sp. P96]|uniref:Helix-turn-helix domain-containing protein n=1 Tax=Paenibacillus zeirhizosphaerae TaxID=2987519 RepID=A0ABT9FXF0_9BACL|nr:helix-turn-helix domain-containing protein [Paenibacillus sp. P96]MDP4099408.1 helix-turn-helix domain-containing protein [Paenibacillus sp. P96]